MKYINLFFIVICTYTILSCTTKDTYKKKSAENQNNRNMGTRDKKNNGYDSIILKIDSAIQNSGTWDALFASKEFIEIYENSHRYVDSAIWFISNKSYSDHQKTVCLYSFQSSDLKDYIQILEVCKTLFLKGRISELLFSRSIDPNFGKRKIIIENNKNGIVRALLEEVKNSDKSSEDLKNTISRVLSE